MNNDFIIENKYFEKYVKLNIYMPISMNIIKDKYILIHKIKDILL